MPAKMTRPSGREASARRDRPASITHVDRERLAFNIGPATVPGRRTIDAQLAREAEPSFATAAYAEPRDWGYLGLLAFTAVLLLRPQDQVPGLSALHLAELSAIIGIAPMLLHRFARRLPVFRVTPETTGLVLFGAVMVATIPFSIWPGGAMGVFTDMYLKVLVVFVLMMNTLTTPKRLDQITWLIVACCGYIAARGVFDYARGVNLVEGNRLAGPVGGFLSNPNDLAMTMVTFLPVAMVMALARNHSTPRRIGAAVVAALMLATIVFTKSRSGAVGLGVMLAVLVLLGRRVRPGFGVISLAVVLVAAPFMPASFWERMSTIIDARQDRTEFTGSREARRVVMREGFETFLERPFTGVGAGQFQNYNPPGRQERWRETHNVLLQVAADLGIFGLAAFCFLIFRAGLATLTTRRMLSPPRRRRRPDRLARVLPRRERQMLYSHTVAMTAAIMGWLACAMFASVAYNWTFYYVLALTVAARELTRDRLLAARSLLARAA